MLKDAILHPFLSIGAIRVIIRALRLLMPRLGEMAESSQPGAESGLAAVVNMEDQTFNIRASPDVVVVALSQTSASSPTVASLLLRHYEYGFIWIAFTCPSFRESVR